MRFKRAGAIKMAFFVIKKNDLKRFKRAGAIKVALQDAPKTTQGNAEGQFKRAGAIKIAFLKVRGAPRSDLNERAQSKWPSLRRRKTQGNAEERSESTKVVYVLRFRDLRIDSRC